MELINIADLKNPETGKTYRQENEVIQVDVKVVEQSYMFQQNFAAVVFYRILS